MRNMKSSTAAGRDLHLIDLAKAAALIVIVFSHLAEQFGVGPYFFNPSPNWPSFGEQLAQILAPAGPGLLGILGAVLRDIAWLGDEGVGLFLVLSGFGLAWGITRAGSFDLRTFVTRRLGRIYPMWLTAHLVIATPLIILGRVSVSAALISAIGIRFLPATYYAIVPAWWYVGLLLQLYACVPVLWWASRKFGARQTMAGAILIGLAARALGWNLAGSYIDEWSRGAIFVTRLPEFAFGFGLAMLCGAAPEKLRAFIGSPRVLALAAVAFVAGIVASMTWYGMIVAPLLTSFGAFVLVCAAFSRVRWALGEWIGKHSYSLYLSHQFTILVFVRHLHSPLGAVVAIALALVTGVALALFLEWLTPRLERTLSTMGVPRLAAAGALALVAIYGTEWAVRTFDPQEANGAGERPSLVADPLVTYKLRPNSRTHLRWETYDYVVQANSLGFPGPEPPRAKTAGVTTVMSLGNAFTSAEGVDTPDSWPRLLQRKDPRFAVADFAITGHGPNQWAEVVREYGPQVKPDLIIIQMWVKDFRDSLLTDDQLRRTIGFGLPSATTPKSFLQLTETKVWLENRVIQPVKSALRRSPNPLGYEFGGFQYFRRADEKTVETAGYDKTRADIEQIRDDAAKWGGHVIIVMFPAAIQVCKSSQLPYYPKYVDFNDTTQYDPDLPQRLASRLAADLHVDYIDMRGAFSSGSCGFAPHNMHLTADGQRIVSDYLSRRLAGHLEPSHLSAR